MENMMTLEKIYIEIFVIFVVAVIAVAVSLLLLYGKK